jgi:phosphatidylglycerophosphate synthase
MVVAAVIVESDGGVSSLTQFGGLSLGKRAVLNAQKAGAATCYVCIPDDAGALRRELENDPRITSNIVWSRPAEDSDTAQTQADGSWLVYSVDAIFRPSLVHYLVKHLPQEQTLALSESGNAPLLAIVSAHDGRRLVRELAQGSALRNSSIFSRQKVRWAPSPPGHFLRRLKTQTDVGRLEHDLLCSLENARDGFVDAHLNRRLSRPLTRWLLRTPLTPNQVTLLAGAFSILGAVCFLPGGYCGPLLGAVLLQCSAVLDCCDGEIARIKFMESPLGDTLDIVCDTIGAIAVFLGIGAAVWKNSGSEHALALGGVLALGGALSFPLVTLAEKTEEAGKQRGGWEDCFIQKVLISLTNRDYSIVILVSALMGQLSWFLWGAAIGAHVFWMVLAWLLFRAGRFGLVWRMWEGRGI